MSKFQIQAMLQVLMKKEQLARWAIGLLLLVGVIGCNPGKTNVVQPVSPIATYEPGGTILPFETVERRTYPGLAGKEYYQPKEPGLLIIATAADIDKARPFIRPEAEKVLEQLDFETQLAILAFRGFHANAHSPLTIRQVSRLDERVMVVAQPGSGGGQAVQTSPYHLVTVEKLGVWEETFAFTMYFLESKPAIAAATHYVP